MEPQQAMQIQMNAVVAEFTEQNNILGQRAAGLSAQLALARAEIAALKAEIEKSKEAVKA